jgi:hypothetical protein
MDNEVFSRKIKEARRNITAFLIIALLMSIFFMAASFIRRSGNLYPLLLSCSWLIIIVSFIFAREKLLNIRYNLLLDQEKRRDVLNLLLKETFLSSLIIASMTLNFIELFVVGAVIIFIFLFMIIFLIFIIEIAGSRLFSKKTYEQE